MQGKEVRRPTRGTYDLKVGDYWNCLQKNHDEMINHFIAKLHDFSVVDPFPQGDHVDRSKRLAFFQLDLELFSVAIWMLMVSDGFELVSTFPFVVDGAVCPLQVQVLSENPPHVDGLVTAWTGDKELTFFDTHFNKYSDYYRSDVFEDFVVSGFASQVYSFASLNEDRNSDSDYIVRVREMVERGGMMLNKLPKKLDVPDRYFYCGPIQNLQTAVVNGVTIYKGQVPLPICDDGPVHAPVVFGADALYPKDWVPDNGNYLCLSLYLHALKRVRN